MWALRRLPKPLKDTRISIGASYDASAQLQTSRHFIEETATTLGSCQTISDKGLSLLRFYLSKHASSDFPIRSCGLSSQAGAESSGEEDDLEDGFSELETPANAETKGDHNFKDETEDGLDSDEELSGDVEETTSNELELFEAVTDVHDKKASSRRTTSELFKAIISTTGISIFKVLDKWVEEGKSISRDEVSAANFNLRKRRMYGRALQLFEWLEMKKQLDFVGRDYASRVDLIAKVQGLQKAEDYIQTIPKSFRGEVIYRTLLANCVISNNLKKAESVFNKMRDLEFPITTFACNQLLLLYKKHDKKKIADVLLLMEKEDIKPSPFTYRILIDAKGLCNDIAGMDQIVETMKAEGFEPDIITQSILAKHYASAGFTEKAEEVLKALEGDDIKQNRWGCKFLLPLYAELGKADEVERIWKVCESKPRFEEYLAAVEAWGKLGQVEKSEAVFDRLLETSKKLPAKHYTKMLKVYSDHKMLQKGKDLVKRMADSGCQIGPLTWDALVKLYVEAGEVEKADTILQKACQSKEAKPMYTSFMAVMEQYAKRGDVHNTEKMFHRMRQAGYVARLRQFQTLVEAYRNAKAPAYGIRERMVADNIFPNKSLAAQLAKVDVFRRTSVSDLLE
ncbi:Pentatricopeptide repeat-containing protein [Hibiscus syriacus]|uniref:Pentatricopeptide repeat-containing protein n=1 Tax=Hibiscus syriacus TaxID=106335 RepID=A0A6A3D0Z9_HIBSY|nr:pentatricopeptide repeat-containing protein At1g80270, mitochondrial-like [Hibiscus syriacus]KAE8734377.1 Pentatricopeptide repeat-containing protein [Hibiscus syriacus]